MSLSLNSIRELRALILSDRVTYKGNEVMSVAAIANELTMEERHLVAAQRVIPRAATAVAAEKVPAPLPPMGSPDEED